VNLQIIDPLGYPGWDELLLRSRDPTFFHSSAWAEVLRAAYRYRPLYFASFENAELAWLMPFMEIRSLLTGRRGVSLPFSDHCPPHRRESASLEEAVQCALDYEPVPAGDISNGGTDHISIKGHRRRRSSIPRSPSRGIRIRAVRLIQRKQRRNIRKAIKDGLNVKIEQSLNR
jgi:hypothetical protein